MNINYIHIYIYVRERMCVYIYIKLIHGTPSMNLLLILTPVRYCHVRILHIFSSWKGESIWVRIGWRLRMLNDTARRKHTNRANPSKQRSPNHKNRRDHSRSTTTKKVKHKKQQETATFWDFWILVPKANTMCLLFASWSGLDFCFSQFRFAQ